MIINILLSEEFLPAVNTLKLMGLVLPLTAISHVLGRQWLMVREKDLHFAFIQLIASIAGFTSILFMIDKFGG